MADVSAAPRSRRDASAADLLDEIEAEGARIRRLKGEVEAAEIARHRLTAAVEALLPALSPAAAEAARHRLAAARRAQTLAVARARAAPLSALTALLAGWDGPQIAVGEAQAWLEEQGLGVNHRYAAHALRGLAGQGVVQKLRRGRYRINRAHPELLALRLAALEGEVAGL